MVSVWISASPAIRQARRRTKGRSSLGTDTRRRRSAIHRIAERRRTGYVQLLPEGPKEVGLWKLLIGLHADSTVYRVVHSHADATGHRRSGHEFCSGFGGAAARQ